MYSKKVVIEMTHIAKMIQDKLNGTTHTKDDFEKMVEMLRDKTYDEAQLAAWLMAVRCLGLSMEETADLTMAMVTKPAGDELLTSVIDKHSTGGVGDSVTLLVVPIVAACGVPLIKLSGKMLGFTGGTIDKLLAIPGIDLEKKPADIKMQVEEVGAYIGMQTDNLCFADKIMYELRDRTGSVASIPLICSSILSKKLSTGAERLVINLKYGNGAFIGSYEEALVLKQYMLCVCERNNVPAKIVIEETNQPIANVIGTGLEIQNIYSILNNEIEVCDREDHLIEVSLNISAEMVALAKAIPYEDAEAQCLNAWDSGAAKIVFEKMIDAQGGHLNELMKKLPKYHCAVKATSNGRVDTINTTKIGQLTNDYAVSDANAIDPLFGLVIEKHLGDMVKENDTLATVHYNDGLNGERLKTLIDELQDCYKIK